MRVLVCGGRDFSDTERAYKVLDHFHKEYMFDVLIEGDARGADRIAGHWARKNKVDLLIFKAQWDTYGKSAGFKRNQQMLDEGKPDLLIAFPGGVGTGMMIQLAKKAGVRIIEV